MSVILNRALIFSGPVRFFSDERYKAIRLLSCVFIETHFEKTLCFCRRALNGDGFWEGGQYLYKIGHQ